MSDLILFENEGFKVRVCMIENDPWWVAQDVCAVLGTQTRDLRKILDPDEISEIPNVDITSTGLNRVLNPETIGVNVVEVGSLVSQRGGKPPLIISEAGLYSLILRSRKPIAKKFRRWVTHEVIPSIRKHGMYVTDPLLAVAKKNPKEFLELAMVIVEESEKRIKAEARVKEQQEKLVIQKQVILESKPLIDFSLRLQDQEGDLSLSKAAKLLGFPGIGRNKLVKMLQKLNIFLAFCPEPRQTYCNLGYFNVRSRNIKTKYGKIRTVTKATVTPKGLAFLHKKIGQELGVF